ncbi:MAG: hypothetical protein KH334_03555, partial [Clostridiales bacterium]|nr:hypothetical protein [Clostridiales bacterium]
VFLFYAILFFQGPLRRALLYITKHPNPCQLLFSFFFESREFLFKRYGSFDIIAIVPIFYPEYRSYFLGIFFLFFHILWKRRKALTQGQSHFLSKKYDCFAHKP